MKKPLYDRWRGGIDLLLRCPVPAIQRRAMRWVYDKDFFVDATEEKRRSAATVAEILAEEYHFESVFDLGCGCGLYLEELKRLGKECLGCDGSRDGVLLAPGGITVFLADVTRPILLNRRFDVVLCFEVAEHLQPRFARQLVKNCTAVSDRVLFTAAPPGQGGVGHINERPYEFWIGLFAQENYQYEQALSMRIRTRMNEAGVVNWLANNFLSFIRIGKE